MPKQLELQKRRQTVFRADVPRQQFPDGCDMARSRPAGSIAQNVRHFRIMAGLTQMQLAERAEMADATISRIERGRLEPSSTIISKLATALHVKADDLLRAPKAATVKPRIRLSVAKLVALVEALDDGQIDDVSRALKLLLAVGRRSRGRS